MQDFLIGEHLLKAHVSNPPGLLQDDQFRFYMALYPSSFFDLLYKLSHAEKINLETYRKAWGYFHNFRYRPSHITNPTTKIDYSSESSIFVYFAVYFSLRYSNEAFMYSSGDLAWLSMLCAFTQRPIRELDYRLQRAVKRQLRRSLVQRDTFERISKNVPNYTGRISDLASINFKILAILMHMRKIHIPEVRERSLFFKNILTPCELDCILERAKEELITHSVIPATDPIWEKLCSLIAQC